MLTKQMPVLSGYLLNKNFQELHFVLFTLDFFVAVCVGIKYLEDRMEKK